MLELEEWGALFDRTPDGRILQRDFGGHRYARLAHVGDRTGLEMIRTLQHRAVSLGIDVFMECKIIRLLQDGDGAVNGAVGVWRETGKFRHLRRQSRGARHRRRRQGVEVHVELVGVDRRRHRRWRSGPAPT